MLSEIIHRLIGLTGYSVVANARFEKLRKLDNYKPSEDVFNEHLRRVFSQMNVTTVLDVGANDGQYAESLRKDAGFEGWIHSFEPLPEKQAALEPKVAKDPRWVLHKYALGEESGEAILNITAQDAFSSLLEPGADQPEKYKDSNTIIEKLKVRVRTVAEVMPEILATSGNGAVYMKMDTQGFDLQVFMGAKGALDHIVALQSELSFRSLYTGSADWLAMTNALAAEGYKPSYFLPISFDDGLAILEADGVFVRHSHS